MRRWRYSVGQESRRPRSAIGHGCWPAWPSHTGDWVSVSTRAMRAEEAEAAATESEDAGALALAHLAQGLALSLDGEPAAVSEHYALGATYATQGGDRQLCARFDANRSHHLLADAQYVEAAAVCGARLRGRAGARLSRGGGGRPDEPGRGAAPAGTAGRGGPRLRGSLRSLRSAGHREDRRCPRGPGGGPSAPSSAGAGAGGPGACGVPVAAWPRGPPGPADRPRRARQAVGRRRTGVGRRTRRGGTRARQRIGRAARPARRRTGGVGARRDRHRSRDGGACRDPSPQAPRTRLAGRRTRAASLDGSGHERVC